MAEYWNMPTLIPQIRTPATVMASLRFISLFIENSFNLKSREAGSLSPAAYLPARKYTA
jgi:hypothetical protein